MKGFDPKWRDLPDYIIGITREIWEGSAVASLNHYYAPDIPMRVATGMVRGNQAVINGTLATLAEFPDRELLGEDVIWSGNDHDGFLSSHRLMTMGTHRGYGFFGEPTGRRFEARAIADCAAKDGVIYDEWLVRDNAAIVRQLGMELLPFVRNLIAREGGPENCERPYTPSLGVQGGYAARGNDHERGEQLAGTLSRIMEKDVAAIQAEYDRACRIEHPGARGGWSWQFAEAAWMQLRSSFPSAAFSVDHQIGRDDQGQPPRAAVRWSLHGCHDGPGLFGKPTGADVYVMGITHAEYGPYGLRREFTLFDEVSIWKQIFLHTGDA